MAVSNQKHLYPLNFLPILHRINIFMAHLATSAKSASNLLTRSERHCNFVDSIAISY